MENITEGNALQLEGAALGVNEVILLVDDGVMVEKNKVGSTVNSAINS